MAVQGATAPVTAAGFMGATGAPTSPGNPGGAVATTVDADSELLPLERLKRFREEKGQIETEARELGLTDSEITALIEEAKSRWGLGKAA